MLNMETLLNKQIFLLACKLQSFMSTTWEIKMVKGIYISGGGMMQRMIEQDVISSNIANVNTNGYKQDSAFLTGVIEAQLALQIRNGEGNFIADKSYSVTDFSQGQMIATGNPLDAALSGSGFFVVRTPQGERYTRDGSFKLSQDGRLVTSNGEPVLGSGGEIQIDGSQVTIGEKGEIFVDGEEVDTLKVVDFEKPYKMHKEGKSLYAKSGNAAEIPSADFAVKQGYSEGANINIVSSMANMINIQKNYDANSKVLTSIDESIRKLVTEVGRM